MKPNEFKHLWIKGGGKLNLLPSNQLAKFSLQDYTSTFLSTSGLPSECAPYISFVKDSNDKYLSINNLKDLYDLPESEFAKYIVIGSDGSGNPIVLNSKQNDQIEWLDHDNYFSATYMNKSIETLADFLIIYRNFVKLVISDNGEDAILNSDFSDSHFDDLKSQMITKDKTAIEVEGFWSEELDMLLINRSEFKNE